MNDWLSKNQYIEVFELSEEALKMIKSSAPTKRPINKNNDDKTLPGIAQIEVNKWKQQDEAIAKFLELKHKQQYQIIF